MESEPEPAHPDIAALFLQHREQMWNAAYRELSWLGLGHLAEDAVTEAILSLQTKPPTGPVRNWQAFLVNATKWRARNLRRAATNEVQRDTKYLNTTTPTQESDFTLIVEEGIDRPRMAAALHAALEKVPERERYALVEFKLGGRSQQEVADELGVTRSRVSQLATRATERLAQILEEEGVWP